MYTSNMESEYNGRSSPSTKMELSEGRSEKSAVKRLCERFEYLNTGDPLTPKNCVDESNETKKQWINSEFTGHVKLLVLTTIDWRDDRFFFFFHTQFYILNGTKNVLVLP